MEFTRHLLLLGAGDNEVLLHLNHNPAKKRMEPEFQPGAVFRVLPVASGENVPGIVWEVGFTT